VIKRRSQRRIPDSELKKNMIAVRLKDEELVALEEISKREDLPVSYFVREGITLVIEKYTKKR
jgi:predicted DNA-binding protein